MSAADEDELLAAARAAAERAYAPYSRYHVGAAVRTADGALYSAANVENASYGLSLCAETNAIAAAVASGARSITHIAVVGYPSDAPTSGSLAMPCGRCRQIALEFAGGDAVVLVASRAGEPARFALTDLMPHAFSPADLRER